MNLPAHRTAYCLEDYLALEASSSVKHEFLAGQIYGMAGGTPEHAALKAAVTGLLFAQLRGGSCRLYDADLRVRVLATGLATYPDVTVVYGSLERDPADAHAVTNPTLIIEVTSPSTEVYDRGDKFAHYQHMPALVQYVLVSHRARELTVWSRADQREWTAVVVGEGQQATLASIGASLDVSELYRVVEAPSA